MDLEVIQKVCQATERLTFINEEAADITSKFEEIINSAVEVIRLSNVFDTFKEYYDEVLVYVKKRMEAKEEVQAEEAKEKKELLEIHRNRMKTDEEYAKRYNTLLEEHYKEEYDETVEKVNKNHPQFTLEQWKQTEEGRANNPEGRML